MANDAPGLWPSPPTLTSFRPATAHPGHAHALCLERRRRNARLDHRQPAAAEFATGSLHHTVLAGLDYQHRNFTGAWYSGSATPIDVVSPQYGNAITGDFYAAPVQRTLRQPGVYLQDQIALGALAPDHRRALERFEHLQPGLRHHHPAALERQQAEQARGRGLPVRQRPGTVCELQRVFQPQRLCRCRRPGAAAHREPPGRGGPENTLDCRSGNRGVEK